MANNDFTLRNNGNDLLNAGDKLTEAKALVCFVQSISLNVRPDEVVTLQPQQLTGFYFVMQNAIERIKEAEELIATALKNPEALGA